LCEIVSHTLSFKAIIWPDTLQTGTNVIYYRSNRTCFVLNTTVFGTNTTVFGTNTTVFGTNTTVFSTNTTVFSTNTTVFGTNTTVFGTNTTVFGTNTTVFGTNTTVFGTNTTVFGTNTTVFSTNITVFGMNTAVFRPKPICFDYCISFPLPSDISMPFITSGILTTCVIIYMHDEWAGYNRSALNSYASSLYCLTCKNGMK
jgi:hypothetical protein